MVAVTVLDSGGASGRVAEAIGARLIARPDSSADADPMIVVVGTARDVQTLARANGQMPIAAAVAWEMPETVLARLLDLPIPVFIGMPTGDQVRRLLEDGTDDLDRSAERARTSRYATFETLLSQPRPAQVP